MALDNLIWIIIGGAIAIVALMLWFGRRDGIVRAEPKQPTLSERLERLDAYEPPQVNNPRIEPPAVDVAVADRTAVREPPPMSASPPAPSPPATDPPVGSSSRPTRK